MRWGGGGSEWEVVWGPWVGGACSSCDMGAWGCSEGLRPSLVAWGGVWFSPWWLGGALVCWATDAGVSSVEWLSSGEGWGYVGVWERLWDWDLDRHFMSADVPSYVFSPVVSEFPLIFFSFLFLLLVFVAVFFFFPLLLVNSH